MSELGALRSGSGAIRAAVKTRAGAIALIGLLLLAGCSSRTAEEHLATANAYLASGEEDAAVIELKNAVKLDSRFIPARLLLAELLFASGDYASAQNDYRRVLAALDGAAVPAADREAIQERLWLMQIRQAQAATVLSDLEELGELTPAQQALLGLARLALDDPELAATEFAAALAADEALPYAHYGSARLAWAAQQLDDAGEGFTRAVELAPRDAELLLTLGEFELGKNNMAGAREAFEAARALPGLDLASRLGLARVLVFERKLDLAQVELDAVLALAAEYLPALYLQALVAYEQGDLKTAEDLLREVQSLQPDYPPARYLLGAVQFRQNNFVQAESNLAVYLATNPDNNSARKLLGAARMQRQDYAGVVDALGPIGESTEDAQALAMLGTAYARVNRLNDASRLLDRAVELAPDVGPLRNQLAVTLLAAGDSDAAIGQLESAIALNEEMALSDYLLVLAQLKNNNAEGALASAEALRDRSPEDPMGENLVGAVKFSQGDKTAAREAFSRSLVIDPGYEPAALNLVRLELEQGQPEAARRQLETLLVADPDSERALLQLAELIMADAGEGNSPQAIAEALALLRRATLARENSLAPRMAQARLGLRYGKLPLARTASAKAVDIAPDNAVALSLHAEALLAGGEHSAAQKPINALARVVRTGRAPAGQLFALAQLQERSGLVRDARATYLELDNSDATVVPTQYFQAANLSLLRADLFARDINEARRRLQQTNASTRQTTVYRLLNADVRRAEGDLASAGEGYEALLAEGNRDALFRLLALDAQHDPGDTKGVSAKRLTSWLAEHPDDRGAQVAQATAALSAGDLVSSRSKFESVLQADPDNVLVLNNLAWLYQQTGDARAREMAERAYELAPQSADVADTYGWILVQGGSVEPGLDVLSKANALAPDNPSIAYHAAFALARSGRTEQALAALGELENIQFAESAEVSALLRQLGPVNDIEGEADPKDKLIK